MRLWRDMEDWGTNHDITPPSKVQHPNARCWLRARSLQVGAVEFGNELLGARVWHRQPMGVAGLTLTQPAKTHTHALWVGVDAGLGEGQRRDSHGLRANARLAMGTTWCG